jgi:ribonuclease T2
MPGVLSGLDRHEWIKHGTCFHAEPEAYFQRAISLIGEVNGSAAQALFAQRAGQTVTAEEIRAAFNQSFGDGAGERVEIHCQNASGGREISEVWLHLAGDVNGAAPLAKLLLAAPPTEADCPSGKVAEAGG